MNPLLSLVLLASAAVGQPQAVNQRSGLLSSQLGLNPLGENGKPSKLQTEGRQATERFGEQECCCIPDWMHCDGSQALTYNPYDIDQRGKNPRPGLRNQAGTTTTTTRRPTTTRKSGGGGGVNFGRKKRQVVDQRIVNIAGDRNSQFGSNYNSPGELNQVCSNGYKACCFTPNTRSQNLYGQTCPAEKRTYCARAYPLVQNNINTIPRNRRNPGCGVRTASFDARGPNHRSLSSPGEYPWLCMILKGKQTDRPEDRNDFVGTCVIVDEPGRGYGRTRRVLTVTHRLENVTADEVLKIRVGEWDASEFDGCHERVEHQEYNVVSFVNHPEFIPKRNAYDLTILYTDRDIDITSSGYVNTACLPNTNTRYNVNKYSHCFVAGWGKDARDGQYQYLQRHVDFNRLWSNQECQPRLDAARQRAGKNPIQLNNGEVCFGGELGKDACDGDGGAPVVCRGQDSRWYAVGLVAWGVGCGQADTPAVYTRLSFYNDFLSAVTYDNAYSGFNPAINKPVSHNFQTGQGILNPFSNNNNNGQFGNNNNHNNFGTGGRGQQNNGGSSIRGGSNNQNTRG